LHFLFCELALKALLLMREWLRILYLSMFCEKLVEQHRVDVLVADAVGFSFFVHQYQGRIDLCYFFSNRAKLGRVGRVSFSVPSFVAVSFFDSVTD
jgi:hypothetical protein